MVTKNPNPILAEAQRALANAPTEGKSVQYPDVLIRFAGLLVVVLTGGLVGWTVVYPALAALGVFAWVGVLIVLVLIAVAAGKMFRAGNVPAGIALAFTYATGQGVLIGGLSRMYDMRFGSGIVAQALLATAITVLVVVGYSATPLGQRTGRAVKAFTIVVVAYLLFSLVSLFLGAVFGVGGGLGVFGLGVFGMLLCLAGVAFAAWSVNVDVVAIVDVVSDPRPQRPGTDWFLAFGLTVSILWLYLEILRLLGAARR